MGDKLKSTLAKTELRQKMRNRLLALSEDAMGVFSMAIAETCFTKVCCEYQCIHIYQSMAREVHTQALSQKLLADGKQLVCPRMTGVNTLEHVSIQSMDELRPGAHGIAEPMGPALSSIECLELVVVPGLAFDEMGRRLGRGGGCYDRFLALGHFLKVGLCFEAQLLDRVPVEHHDVGMDIIVTEKRLIQCG